MTRHGGRGSQTPWTCPTEQPRHPNPNKNGKNGKGYADGKGGKDSNKGKGGKSGKYGKGGKDQQKVKYGKGDSLKGKGAKFGKQRTTQRADEVGVETYGLPGQRAGQELQLIGVLLEGLKDDPTATQSYGTRGRELRVRQSWIPHASQTAVVFRFPQFSRS